MESTDAYLPGHLNMYEVDFLTEKSRSNKMECDKTYSILGPQLFNYMNFLN